MNYFLINASALVKRYHVETGTALINELFDATLGSDPKRLIISVLTLAETVAVLYRRGNERSVPRRIL